MIIDGFVVKPLILRKIQIVFLRRTGELFCQLKKTTFNFQLCGSKSDPQGIPTYMASIQSVVSAAAIEIKVLKVL